MQVAEGAIRHTASIKTFRSAFACFASKYANEDNEEKLLSHVDKLWARYDTDSSGFLEEKEARQFFSAVWNWLDGEGVVCTVVDQY